MRSFILSQCRDLRMGVILEDLGALTTYEQDSSESAGSGLFETQEDCSRERVTVVEFRVDNRGSNGTGCQNQGKDGYSGAHDRPMRIA